MALSYVQYQGDGSTQTYAIPFQYLKPEDVKLKVALDDRAFTWDSAGVARISPAPATGAVIEFRRVTERNSRLVDFVDSSVLTESDLDLALTQTFYIVQEAIDIAGGTLELLPDGSYGAGGRRIKELATPVEARDAVTKEYHDGTFIPQMVDLLNQTVTSRDLAGGAMQTAQGARDAAIAARDLALQYRDTTKGYRDEVQAWNTNVNTKSANVDTKNDNVNTKSANVDTKSAQVDADKATTLGYRNEAEGFKNDAAASAAAAQTWNPENYISKTGAGFGPFSFRNKLINPFGDTLIHQRASLTGWSYTIAANSSGWVADRWMVENKLNVAVNVTSNGGASTAANYLEIVPVSAPTSGVVEVYQRVEGVQTLHGRKAIFSYDVQYPSALVLTNFATQQFGTGGSPSPAVLHNVNYSYPSGNAWVRAFTVHDMASISGKSYGTSGTHQVQTGLSAPLRSTQPLRVRRLQFEAAPSTLQPSQFEERPLHVEFMMCQRYYERGRTHILSGAAAAGWYFGMRNPFKVTKRSVPVVREIAGLSSLNAGNFVIAASISEDGFTSAITSTAAATVVEWITTWDASAEL